MRAMIHLLRLPVASCQRPAATLPRPNVMMSPNRPMMSKPCSAVPVNAAAAVPRHAGPQHLRGEVESDEAHEPGEEQPQQYL